MYLKLAYVNLSMHRPERSLYCLEKLKTDAQATDSEIVHCICMYEVEALCMLDRSSEAAEMLKAHVERQDAVLQAAHVTHGSVPEGIFRKNSRK